MLTDEEMGIKNKPITISMNHPLTHRKLTFYQSSYERLRGRDGRETGTFQSVLQVGYDAGRFLKYLGCAFIVLGAFLQFTMKAGLFSDGGKRDDQKAADRARRLLERKGQGRSHPPRRSPANPRSPRTMTTRSSDVRPDSPPCRSAREQSPEPRRFPQPGADDATIRMVSLRPRPGRGPRPRRVGLVRRREAQGRVVRQGSQAYKALGLLPVMHAGRKKPLDTLAREEIKQIFGRETDLAPQRRRRVRRLMGARRRHPRLDGPSRLLERSTDHQGRISPAQTVLAPRRVEVAALRDRRQGFDPGRRQGGDQEGRSDGAEIGLAELEPLLRSTTLPKDDRLAIARLHAKLGEGHKWLTPQELEDAVVKGADGQPTPFFAWIESIAERNREASITSSGEAKLTEIEEKGYEAGTAFSRYRSLRDRDMSRFLPILVMPRPFNQTYLTYTGQALTKAQAARSTQGRDLSNFDLEAAVVLNKYLENVQSKDMALPGTDSEFDAKYANWLKEKSTWLPLVMLLGAKTEELEKAGFPVAKVEAVPQGLPRHGIGREGQPRPARRGNGQ